jgi:hypothetical protein
MRGSLSDLGETRARGEASPGGVQRFRHDFEYDDLVVHRLAAWGAGECGQSAETLGQMLSDFGVFFGLQRLAAVVMEWQKYLDQMHRKPPRSEPQHSEHEKQRHRDRRRHQQRSEATEPVREEEKHGESGSEKRAAQTDCSIYEGMRSLGRDRPTRDINAAACALKAALAWRPQFAREPAHGIGLHGIDGHGNLVGPFAGGALERPLFEPTRSGRNSCQRHPVFAHRTHWPIVDRITHNLTPRITGSGLAVL